VARMIGHITYLSDDVMAEKFGRDNFITRSEAERVQKLDRKPGRPPKKE